MDKWIREKYKIEVETEKDSRELKFANYNSFGTSWPRANLEGFQEFSAVYGASQVGAALDAVFGKIGAIQKVARSRRNFAYGVGDAGNGPLLPRPARHTPLLLYHTAPFLQNVFPKFCNFFIFL